MTRITLSLLAAFLTSSAYAAPVPKVALSPEQEAEFNRLWKKAGIWDDRPADVELVCRLLVQPVAATEFLKGKLQPFTRTAREIEDRIAKLDSEKEAEWKPAFEDLRVYDVRLTMTLPEAWELAKSDRQKNRLGMIWHIQVTSAMARERERQRAKLTACSFTLVSPGPGQTSWYMDAKGPSFSYRTGQQSDLDEWVKVSVNAFDRERVRLGLQVLEQIGTPEAKAVIRRMTTGHEGVGPTKDANEIVDRLKAKAAAPLGESPISVGLRLLCGWNTSYSLPDLPAHLTGLLRHPERTVRFLKPKLRPLKLDEARAVKLLTALFDDKEAVWRPAFVELSNLDFRLAIPLSEAWVKAESPDQRVRLKWLCTGEVDPNDQFRDYRLSPSNDSNYELVLWSHKRAGVTDDQLPKDFSAEVGRLIDEQVSRLECWHRHESAIYILDAIGTDDAIAIIQDMATGHPDAGPTKAAKAVLKRRGK